MEAAVTLACATTASLLTAITMLSRTQAGVATVALLMTRACPTVYEDRMLRPVFVRAHRRRPQRGPPARISRYGQSRTIHSSTDQSAARHPWR